SRKGTDEIASDTLNLDEVEKAAVVKAIQLHSGNISKAAEELGLTRASLYRRMEKYGI
ncbi:MAG: helix-turn-helix domain-containing protein, partial [Cyclobacteriaceae bacterium]|nr:helix-turn-helix domain-containing protein [Cyclobacteriaceae bacterium]